MVLFSMGPVARSLLDSLPEKGVAEALRDEAKVGECGREL
jgi:hypothetical protein